MVLLHDSLLSHGTTLDGWAHERRGAEILSGRLKDSEGRVTEENPLLLQEGLALMSGHSLTVQIEIKSFCDPALADRTSVAACDALEERGAVPTGIEPELISFWPGAVAIAASRGYRTRLIVASPHTPLALAGWAAEEGVTGIILEAAYWASGHVDTWRAAGLSVMSGVCNDVEMLDRILPFKPDAVATDRPHELRWEVTPSGEPA